MNEQTREQQLHQIISELFQIVDDSTLNIATWPKYDALQARYQAITKPDEFAGDDYYDEARMRKEMEESEEGASYYEPPYNELGEESEGEQA